MSYLSSFSFSFIFRLLTYSVGLNLLRPVVAALAAVFEREETDPAGETVRRLFTELLRLLGPPARDV